MGGAVGDEVRGDGVRGRRKKSWCVLLGWSKVERISSPLVGYSSMLEIPSLCGAVGGAWFMCPLSFSFKFSILVILTTGSVML